MYWIPITREDGSLISEADGERTVPIHAVGPRGMPINAIKVFEYANNARMDFVLKILGGSIRAKELETIFLYGGTHGYAGERSAGEGRYSFQIEQIGEVFTDTSAKALKGMKSAASQIAAFKMSQAAPVVGAKH